MRFDFNLLFQWILDLTYHPWCWGQFNSLSTTYLMTRHLYEETHCSMQIYDGKHFVSPRRSNGWWDRSCILMKLLCMYVCNIHIGGNLNFCAYSKGGNTPLAGWWMSLTISLNANFEKFLIWVLLTILKMINPCNG